MQLADIIDTLEKVAPPFLQEDYDNSGLLVGNRRSEISKALLCLDSTEAVIDEAIATGCDLIIAHHPIVFKGLKRFNGSNYVERAIIKAIQNNIAIYACHTNLDNVLHQGVNSKIAEKLGLIQTNILKPITGKLCKLVLFAPNKNAEQILEAMFNQGAGKIGNYDECSFSLQGSGTFRAGDNSNPFVGEKGMRHVEAETRIEVVLPEYSLNAVLEAAIAIHPYEEVAYDIYRLENGWAETGSGLIGRLAQPIKASDFPTFVKDKMQLSVLKYTNTEREMIERVAVCGGSGSFLIETAKRNGADAYITSDVKYHEFFDADNQMILCDIGHYESEKYTPELFAEIISKKMPNFALVFARTHTNPIKYHY